MKKINYKNGKRVIWTFVPDEDVAAILEAVLKDGTRGEKTEIINQAIREKHAEAAAKLAEAQAKIHLDRAAALRNKASGKH